MILHKAGERGSGSEDQVCKFCKRVLRLRNFNGDFLEENKVVGEKIRNGRTEFYYGRDVYRFNQLNQKYCYAIVDSKTRIKYLKDTGQLSEEEERIICLQQSVYFSPHRKPNLDDYDTWAVK